MNRDGIILDTATPLDASERRARWYAKAASLGLLILGPRPVPPQPASVPDRLPSVGADSGKVAYLPRKRA